MNSTMWVFIGLIAVTAIVMDGIVKIIRASKSGKVSTEVKDQLMDMDEDLTVLKTELEDARQRIEVLEKIVTDNKYELHRQLDELAG